MPEIYCKKCGVRGNSKCPHCRSVFQNRNPSDMSQFNQEFLEMFMQVGHDPAYPTPTENGERRFLVSFWTYAMTGEEALKETVERLKIVLTDPGVNLSVAGCMHDWELIPGEKSSCGCGHVGPEHEVPADPYKKE